MLQKESFRAIFRKVVYLKNCMYCQCVLVPVGAYLVQVYEDLSYITAILILVAEISSLCIFNIFMGIHHQRCNILCFTITDLTHH